MQRRMCTVIVAFMHRLFVAIRPPPPILDLLVDTMDDGPTLRWVPEENLHLTLRFIGEVERPLAEDIAASLDKVKVPPFALRLAGVGLFDRRSGGAVWAGVAPRGPVKELAAKVERACQQAGLSPETRAFAPHVTIARYGRDSRLAAEQFTTREAGLQSASFDVTRFTLFESRLSRHGALYERIADYALT